MTANRARAPLVVRTGRLRSPGGAQASQPPNAVKQPQPHTLRTHLPARLPCQLAYAQIARHVTCCDRMR